jgi:hypothetical protein
LGLLHITLYWQVNAPFDRNDLTVFVHGLDMSGNLITQNDAPPFGGKYLPTEWLPGQTLIDLYTLDEYEIRQIAIGVYTPEERLPIVQDGIPTPDNRILLPVRRLTCEE